MCLLLALLRDHDSLIITQLRTFQKLEDKDQDQTYQDQDKDKYYR